METVCEEDGTGNHKCDQSSHETRLESNTIPEQEKVLQHKKVEIHRQSLSIGEKRAIIENYDMLPATMSKKNKAECLGIKYPTLLGILLQRDKIFAMKDTETRDELYKNRSSRKIDSQILFSRKNDFLEADE